MQSFRKQPEAEGLSVCVCKIRRQSKEGKEESSSGSVVHRDERESTEEGCGGVVFTGHRDTGRCGFVHQHMCLYHGLPQYARNLGHIYSFFKQFVQVSGSMWLTKQQKTLLSSVFYKHKEKEVEAPCCGPLLTWVQVLWTPPGYESLLGQLSQSTTEVSDLPLFLIRTIKRFTEQMDGNPAGSRVCPWGGWRLSAHTSGTLVPSSGQVWSVAHNWNWFQ